ncbi:type II toxin-antitoxin system HipA family toxin [Flexibacterium corallicola]|uniref:type II toxin-antitoxin system HipA family toxin n=1 Tax=Flexibacterium corallicola TaxID=3037259 RepID=UPI00286F8188|nr:type II toxin-antitoxin system HipA family toxin [Pseudovibrio sp. M1P-2-3]
MGRRRSNQPLSVFMNGRRVGTLDRRSSGAISFTYAPHWLEWAHAMPVSRSLPLQPQPYVGAKVVAVFDNLLPDNPDILNRVADRVGAAGTDAYSMLTEIGRECIGALQFLPDRSPSQPAGTVTGHPRTNDQIEALLNELDVAPLGIRKEHDFRISIAGAQEKTALLFHGGQWISPSGTTPTTHILKPQIGKLANEMDLSDSVENEYLCLKFLDACGLRTAKVSMATFGARKTLVVERFDRNWTGDGRLLRLPQEDMCQALSVPPNRKYQSEGGPGIVEMMEFLKGSDEPNQDRHEFFKANILFWLIGATDGHAKNFSIALMPGGGFRLTPFYDVLSLQPMLDQRRIARKDFRLAMRVGTSKHYKIEKIFPRHFIETGAACGHSKTVVQGLLADIHATALPALQQTIAELPSGFPSRLTQSLLNGVSIRLARLAPS